MYRRRWKYARPCESPEGRALRISISGVLLVAIDGKGDILRLVHYLAGGSLLCVYQTLK